jgi:hypothetical protein
VRHYLRLEASTLVIHGATQPIACAPRRRPS